MNNYLTICRNKIAQFLAKPFFHDYRTIFVLWVLMCIIVAITKSYNSDGNYRIFIGVWNHTIEQLPLFDHYPLEYDDMNHYGPFFALVIAPFAWMNRYAGMAFWMLFLSMFLYVSVRKSDFTKYQQLFVFWFCSHELLNALFLQQYNIAITAGVLLTFTMIERKQDFWAAFFIMLGTMIKLYGIVGLAFFFFSKNKLALVLSCLFWGVVMFVAPMAVSSPEYIIQQYYEWYIALVEKNADNINVLAGNMADLSTNISLLGMVRRTTQIVTYSDLWLIIPGIIAFLIPYLRISQYKYVAFRQTLLASVLMFTVLFSTGSENSTYIIAFAGVALWYCCAPWKRSKWDIALMVVVFIISSLSPGDLFPKAIYRGLIQPYALKALPVTIVWFKLCYEMYTRDYTPAVSRAI
ncbi:MAG: DUF2029 domain-containing protein [Prevotella sp.]|nr:DUF2029 domain-containing protein [Prevotella sp.]